MGSRISTATQYGRRDLIMALRHAMRMVAEAFPETEPLGIGLISMPDGSTPWGEPFWTHNFGSTADLAYFVDEDHLGEWGNRCYRQICAPGAPDDTSAVGLTTTGACAAGSAATHIVDVARTALLLAELGATGLVSTFAMDPAPRADLEAELARLDGEGHPAAGAASGLIVTAEDDPEVIWLWHHLRVTLLLPSDPGFPY
jgi:hypothetical protein